MVWTIDYTEAAQRELRRLDRQIARRIVDYMDHVVATQRDPRRVGTALHGSALGGYWRYRVGDYRIVCDIEDAVVRILVVQIGHRRDVYR